MNQKVKKGNDYMKNLILTQEQAEGILTYIESLEALKNSTMSVIAINREDQEKLMKASIESSTASGYYKRDLDVLREFIARKRRAFFKCALTQRITFLESRDYEFTKTTDFKL